MTSAPVFVLATFRQTNARERLKDRARHLPQHFGAYVGQAMRLRSQITKYGLGQSFAGLIEAAQESRLHPCYLLFSDLQSWLCREEAWAPYDAQVGLMEAITAGDQDAYLLAHAEALNWLVEITTSAGLNSIAPSR